MVGTEILELIALGPKNKAVREMNNKGQNAKYSGHLVLLLAVVGLAAFSSAMKDLSQIHQYALDASDLVASLTTEQNPTIEIPTIVAKLETCDSNKSVEQSIPSVELPWLDDVKEEKIEVEEIEAPQPPAPARRVKVPVVRPARVPHVDFDPVQLEVRVSDDHAAESDVAIPTEFPQATEFPQFTFRKTRKSNVIRISPRDREMLLKTLNRSINLRIAS